MMTDQAVKSAVLAELAWEPMVSADHVAVSVRDGVATLGGHVDSFWQKQLAEKAAGRVKGVKGITADLVVRLPPGDSRADDAIAAAIVRRMDWDAMLPPNAVKVEVQDGFVTLSGTVAHRLQVVAASWAVQPLWGVTGVANQITVLGPAKRPASPDKLSDDIRSALNRGWFAADTVHVAAADGVVTLSGSAETLRDRTLAVATAWSAPGTTDVANHIRIG